MFRIFVLLAFCGGVLPTRADGGTDLRRSLEGRYAALKSAMDRRDAAALSLILTSDFVAIDTAGKSENAAQMLDKLKKVPKDANRRTRTTLRSIIVKGRTAVIEQWYEMKTSKTGADGVAQNIELRTVSEDVWLESSGVWRLKSTSTEQLDYFVNGRAAVHKTRERSK